MRAPRASAGGALEVGRKPIRGPRRRVATVEQRVDADRPGRRDARASSSDRDRHGGRSAWTPPGPMRPIRCSRAAGPAARAHGSHEHRAREERAVRDGGVDARQVLEDRPAGAEVQVADLAVAHLARPAARRRPGGLQHGVRPLAPAGARQVGIRAAAIASRGGIVPDAEAVEDDQDDRSRPAHAPPGRPRRSPSRGAARPPAVSPARATMPAISSTFRRRHRRARRRSSGSARNSPMCRGRDAAAVQDRQVVGGRCASPARARHVPDRVGHGRRVAARCAFRPVPIAQTGS